VLTEHPAKGYRPGRFSGDLPDLRGRDALKTASFQVIPQGVSDASVAQENAERESQRDLKPIAWLACRGPERSPSGVRRSKASRGPR